MSIPGNSRLSERLAILTSIKPSTFGTAAPFTAYSSWIDLQSTNGNTFGRLEGVFHLGAITGTNGVTCSLLASSNSAGSGSVALQSKVFGTAADGDIQTIDCNVQKLTSSNRYVALYIATTANSVGNAAAVLYGGDAKYEPVTAYNASVVATAIAV